MSRFFKSAAFPILIVVVLAFFAQKLINPSQNGPRTTTRRSSRTSPPDNVKSAVIKTKDNTLDVTLKDPPKQKHELGFCRTTATSLVNELRRRESRLQR